MKNKGMMPVLTVDDDKDDQFFTETALRKNGVINPIVPLLDGEELMDYLQRKNKYSNFENSPRPCLILLDLNMPKMGGRKVLELVKADPELKKIPVVVLSTSNAEEDIEQSYDLGANSYITKSVDFVTLISMMAAVKQYWLDIVELPSHRTSQNS